MIVECPGCRSRYDVTGRPPGTRARCRCGQVFSLPQPKNQAGMLSCPACGGNVAPTNHRCEFCEAALKVKACPRCFAKVFHGSKHCNMCGAEVDVPAHANADGSAVVRRCPRCASHPTLDARLVADVLLDECPDCHGVWLDIAAVERVVRERRQASADAILNMPRPDSGERGHCGAGEKLYVRCPDCDSTMNRVNFGRRSGIILDVCRPHGTWFDANELPRVVEFVSRGGLEKAAMRDIDRMKAEARRARTSARYEAAKAHTQGGGGYGWGSSRAASNVSLFGGLLGAIGRTLLD